jgi:cytochrome c553
MRNVIPALALLCAFSIHPAHAANIEAGKAAAEPCTVCHGANGVGVSDDIPNLAGQKLDYLATQLKAFRAGKRSNAMMNALATQLSDADIENITAYFNSLTGGADAVAANIAAAVNTTNIAFPANYKDSFKHYLTINFPERKQVRRYLANEAAITAAREGKPMPNGSFFLVEVYAAKLDGDGKPVTASDGFFEPDKLAFYTAMQMEVGWGKDIPKLYRNGDWNYAVIGADGKVKAGNNQAKCFACHKPLAGDSYLFTIKQLAESAKQ